MNVLNKYGFIDHFKMQDSISFYAEDFPLSLQNTYKNAFNNGVLYPHECSSTKKLLNVIDSMIRVSIFFYFFHLTADAKGIREPSIA